jgi:MraZ protein
VLVYYSGILVTAVDGKGRVSIPPAFRRVLKNRCGHEDEVMIGRDKVDPCLEGYDVKYFNDENAKLEQQYLDFDEAREAARIASARRLTSRMRSFNIEAPGRIILPQMLRDAAGISDAAVFVAVGSTFQIWGPDRARQIKDDFIDVGQAIDEQLAQKGARS